MEFRLEDADAATERFAGGLFFAEHERQFAELLVEGGDGVVTVAQARVEFAFTQG